MKRKYSAEEDVFAFIWDNADRDGLWIGDAATLAAEFGVSEAEAYETLGYLCDRNHLQRVGRRDFIIVRWRERDDCDEEDEPD
jgi:hypothetical protein